MAHSLNARLTKAIEIHTRALTTPGNDSANVLSDTIKKYPRDFIECSTLKTLASIARNANKYLKIQLFECIRDQISTFAEKIKACPEHTREKDMDKFEQLLSSDTGILNKAFFESGTEIADAFVGNMWPLYNEFKDVLSPAQNKALATKMGALPKYKHSRLNESKANCIIKLKALSPAEQKASDGTEPEASGGTEPATSNNTAENINRLIPPPKPPAKASDPGLESKTRHHFG